MLNLLWAKCPHSVSSGSLWEPLSICFFLYWQSLIFFSLCLTVTWSGRAYHKSSTCWRWFNTLDGPLALSSWTARGESESHRSIAEAPSRCRLKRKVERTEHTTQSIRHQHSSNPVMWPSPWMPLGLVWAEEMAWKIRKVNKSWLNECFKVKDLVWCEGDLTKLNGVLSMVAYFVQLWWPNEKILFAHLWWKAGPHTRTVLSSDAEASTWPRARSIQIQNEKLKTFIELAPDGRPGSRRHSWPSCCGHSAQQWPRPSSRGRCTPATTTLTSGPQIKKVKVVTLLSSEPEATKAWSRPPKQLWIV